MKKPVAISGRQGDYYREVFSEADVERVVQFVKPTQADILVVKEGGYFNESFFNSDWTPNLRMIYRAYYQGYSIVLNHLERSIESLAAFTRRMEASLAHPIGINMYLTPKHAQAFKAHYDTHSIFVLQIEGAKRWSIYKPIVEWPLEERRDPIGPDELGDPVYDVELTAGDLLYVPQGFVHEARTYESSSLHLTLGMFLVTWADLLGSAVEAMKRRDVRLRQPLPIGLLLDGELKGAAVSRYTESMDLVARCSIEEAIGQQAMSFLLERQILPGRHFSSINSVGDISLDTKLVKRPGTICRVLGEGGLSGIQFSGNQVTGPARISEAFRFIASSQEFYAGAVPGLESEEKLVLIRRLVREGLLTVAS
jgi:hypothetical protein